MKHLFDNKLFNKYSGTHLPLDHLQLIKVKDIENDFDLHLDKKNCQLLKRLFNHAKNSEY